MYTPLCSCFQIRMNGTVVLYIVVPSFMHLDVILCCGLDKMCSIAKMPVKHVAELLVSVEGMTKVIIPRTTCPLGLYLYTSFNQIKSAAIDSCGAFHVRHNEDHIATVARHISSFLRKSERLQRIRRHPRLPPVRDRLFRQLHIRYRRRIPPGTRRLQLLRPIQSNPTSWPTARRWRIRALPATARRLRKPKRKDARRRRSIRRNSRALRAHVPRRQTLPVRHPHRRHTRDGRDVGSGGAGGRGEGAVARDRARVGAAQGHGGPLHVLHLGLVVVLVLLQQPRHAVPPAAAGQGRPRLPAHRRPDHAVVRPGPIRRWARARRSIRARTDARRHLGRSRGVGRRGVAGEGRDAVFGAETRRGHDLRFDGQRTEGGSAGNASRHSSLLRKEPPGLLTYPPTYSSTATRNPPTASAGSKK